MIIMVKVTTIEGEIIILGLREITCHIANQSGHEHQSEDWWSVNFTDRTDEELLDHVRNLMYPTAVRVELNC